MSGMKRIAKPPAETADTQCVRQRESKSESTARVTLFDIASIAKRIRAETRAETAELLAEPAVEPMHVAVVSNVSRKGVKQAPAPVPYVAPAVGLACSPPSRTPPTSGSASSSSFAGWSSYADCVKYISKYAHKGRDPILCDHRPADEIEDFGRRRHASARLRGARFDWEPAPWYGGSSSVPE